MVTSVLAVGTILLCQFLQSNQSVLTVPVHIPGIPALVVVNLTSSIKNPSSVLSKLAAVPLFMLVLKVAHDPPVTETTLTAMVFVPAGTA